MQHAIRRWARWRVASALYLLLAALVGCARTPPATTPTLPPAEQLRADLAAATRQPGVRRGAWGIVVHSLDRDERLFELNPQTLLVPASVAKLASVATAAAAVGWDYRFETTLLATGPIVNGVLEGDLVVVGSGDPSIGGRGGEDVTPWITALKAQGVRRVAGRIIGDDNRIEEPRPQLAWAWDDLGYSTGALFGALNYAENRLTIVITPGAAAGTPAAASLEPHATIRALDNRVVTSAPATNQLLWPEQRPGLPYLTIAGTIPVGAAPALLNVSAGNPTLWFASAFRTRLQQQGIEVAGEAWDIDDVMPPIDTTGATTVYTHRSPPLSELVRPVLKDSVNLYAEAVMRLNAAPGQPATNDAALEGFRARLSAWGIPDDAQQVVDGSGLSRRDTISPDAVLAILKRMYDQALASPFASALPVAGVDGSLAGRMQGTPAAGNVRAKTGTMSNIRSLAGYVTTQDGERLAFVAMVNNFEGPGAAANRALDAIAVRLAGFTRMR